MPPAPKGKTALNAKGIEVTKEIRVVPGHVYCEGKLEQDVSSNLPRSTVPRLRPLVSEKLEVTRSDHISQYL